MTFKRGDFVRVAYFEDVKRAMVALASDNGRSLVLLFDGALRAGPKGVFLGSMPVLQHDDGVFYDLLDPPNPVSLERLEIG